MYNKQIMKADTPCSDAIKISKSLFSFLGTRPRNKNDSEHKGQRHGRIAKARFHKDTKNTSEKVSSSNTNTEINLVRNRDFQTFLD